MSPAAGSLGMMLVLIDVDRLSFISRADISSTSRAREDELKVLTVSLTRQEDVSLLSSIRVLLRL